MQDEEKGINSASARNTHQDRGLREKVKNLIIPYPFLIFGSC
jgi:hypothetical protein